MFQSLYQWITKIDSEDLEVQRRGHILIIVCILCIFTNLTLRSLRFILSPIQGDSVLNFLGYGLTLVFFGTWFLTRRGYMWQGAMFLGFGYPTCLFVVNALTTVQGFEPFILAVCLSPLVVGLTSKQWAIWTHFVWLCVSLIAFHIYRGSMSQDGILYQPVLIASFAIAIGCTIFSWIYQSATAQAIQQLVTTQEQLKEATIRAEAANQAKSNFLANMSHELRTPLNAIIGYSELITEELCDLGHQASPLVHDAKRVTHSGKNLLQLINDILDLSKIEAGHMHIIPQDFNIKALIDEVCDTISPAIQSHQNILIRHEDALNHIQLFSSDRLRIKQILLNLLSNAAKFTNQGQITLTTNILSVEGTPHISFEVTDTGLGMHDDVLQRIFEEFVQAEEHTAHTYGGTGLGLPLCKRFCHILGGFIEVTSNPGEGSMFRVTLPELTSNAMQSVPSEVLQAAS